MHPGQGQIPPPSTRLTQVCQGPAGLLDPADARVTLAKMLPLWVGHRRRRMLRGKTRACARVREGPVCRHRRWPDSDSATHRPCPVAADVTIRTERPTLPASHRQSSAVRRPAHADKVDGHDRASGPILGVELDSTRVGVAALSATSDRGRIAPLIYRIKFLKIIRDWPRSGCDTRALQP